MKKQLFASLVLVAISIAGVLALSDTAFADACTDCSDSCYFQWQADDAACDEFADNPQEFRECERAAVADFMQCQTTCVPLCI